MKNTIKPTVTLAFDDLEIICRLASQAILIDQATLRIRDGEDVEKWESEKNYAIRMVGEYVTNYTLGDDPTVHRIISDEALGLIEALGEA